MSIPVTLSISGNNFSDLTFVANGIICKRRVELLSYHIQ